MKKYLFFIIFIASIGLAKNPVSINWELDQSGIFMMDLMQVKLLFQEKNNPFNIIKNYNLTPKDSLASFKTTLKQAALHLDKKEPHLIINITGHGIPGFMLKQNGEKIDHTDFKNTFSLLPPNTRIDIFYAPCFGNSIFEAFKLSKYNITIFTGSDDSHQTPMNTYYNTIMLLAKSNHNKFTENLWPLYTGIRRMPENTSNLFSTNGFIYSTKNNHLINASYNEVLDWLNNINPNTLNNALLTSFYSQISQYNQ